jgi:signal peptidase I
LVIPVEDQRYQSAESRHPGRRWWPLLVLPVLAGAGWWRRRRPFVVAVEGESMGPALRPGDFLMAVRPDRDRVRRGATVVVERPGGRGFELVKRMAAVPGDRVGDRVLAPDEYWVLGDNAAGSTDSRSFGSVGMGAVRGVVLARYWPPSRIGRV